MNNHHALKYFPMSQMTQGSSDHKQFAHCNSQPSIFYLVPLFFMIWKCNQKHSSIFIPFSGQKMH